MTNGPKLSTARAIQDAGRAVFTTGEIAALRRASTSSTSQALARMERDGLVVRAARGVWCVPTDPRFTPFSLVSFLASGHHAYVSFLSALHLWGMIEQVPQVINAATTAHTRVQKTPLASFSFHRIEPRVFDGFDWYPKGQLFLIASREKALVDCLYLSSRKGRRFGNFPEIEFDRKFSRRRAREWARRIPDAQIRTHTEKRLESILTRPTSETEQKSAGDVSKERVRA